MKNEYILGQGYPVFRGTFPNVFVVMSMSKKPYDPELDDPDYVVMDKPQELEGLDCPKYELVLRRVK